MTTSTDTGAEHTKLQWLPLALLSAIIGLLPMIVYMRVVSFEGIAQELYGKSGEGDFFSYYKYIWLCVLTGSALLWFMANRRAEPNWYHKPLVVYSFFTVVSTVFARHRTLAFYGDPSRHEGMLAQLSYMAVVFLFINLIRKRAELKILLSAVLISAAILATVGALQFFGHDYFFADFSEHLLVPQYIKDTLGSINMSSMKSSMHSIFLTFGNGNFTGSYMTMLFALTLALLFGLPKKWRFVFLPLNLLIFFNLLGCKSRAGQLGGVLAILIILLFMRKRLKQNMGLIILLLVSFALMPFAMDAYTLRKDLTRFLSTSIARSTSFSSGIFGNFRDLRLEKDLATVDFDGVIMQISFNDEKIEFYDQNGEFIPHHLLTKPTDDMQVGTASDTPDITTPGITLFSLPTNDMIPFLIETPAGVSSAIASQTAVFGKDYDKKYLVVFPEKKLRGYVVIACPKFNVLQISRGGISFYLVYTNTGFKLLDQHLKPSEIKEIETFGFEGREGFASNRGYIWSRSIPLLKHTILLGFGPDTFAAHFPNHDYLGKLKTWGSGIFQMIEKPHNIFLQIALNTGLSSLIAILALLAVYLYESASLYWNSRLEQLQEVAGLGISTAVVAYLAAGIFNDSAVTVAPVFWSLLGMGMATNRINKQSQCTSPDSGS